MTGDITVSRERATEIFQALRGIGALLKKLPSTPETTPVMYGIMSNIAVIESHLTGIPRVNSN
jgi:hypothetical protein